MSTRTRRRLILCVVIAALTLPLDFILVRAATTDAQTLASQWADSLTEPELAAAADMVDLYPLEYRREIMANLNVDQRAKAWVRHLERYRDARPELSTEQVDAINAAIAITPVALTSPTAENREATRVIAERIIEVLGADVADYLLHRLGARETRVLVNAAPWHHRLTNFARQAFVVSAMDGDGCNCNVDYGCDLLSLSWCDGNESCDIDNRWPACGWLWNDPCNGVCKIGAVG